MTNLVRALLYNKEISLTVADTTALVNEGSRLHALSPASAYAYGKAMSALAYISSGLKEEEGEVSITVQCDGEGNSLCASGNRALFLRGYIENTQIEGAPDQSSEKRAFGKTGSFTLVRDDGYNRPFVGTCAFPDGGFDEIVEEYYRLSEQLPTRIRTRVEIDGDGKCSFAGVIALQPLPFAREETLKTVASLDIEEWLSALKGRGVERFVTEYFPSAETQESRYASYRCNCSRGRLSEVLITLGKKQLAEIAREEGAVCAHCHYCNTQYRFTMEDIEKLYEKKAN